MTVMLHSNDWMQMKGLHLPRRLPPARCLCVSLPRCLRPSSGLLLLRSEELLVRERLRRLRFVGDRERDLHILHHRG